MENDLIMQEIRTLLSFDGSEQGWVVICKGTATGEMEKANRNTILKTIVDASWLLDHPLWRHSRAFHLLACARMMLRCVVPRVCDWNMSQF